MEYSVEDTHTLHLLTPPFFPPFYSSLTVANENHTPQYPGPQDQGTTTPDSQLATTQPATTEQPSTTEAVTTSQPLTTASTTEAVSTAETSSPATQKTADEPKTEADTHTDRPDSTPTDAIPSSILQDGNKTVSDCTCSCAGIYMYMYI